MDFWWKEKISKSDENVFFWKSEKHVWCDEKNKLMCKWKFYKNSGSRQKIEIEQIQ